MSESVRLTGIKQGSGKSVSVAFGNRGVKGKKTKRNNIKMRRDCNVWDAFHPSHLPLPRAVAPYTVIRTTQVWAPDDKDPNLDFALFGPIKSKGGWSSAYCLSSNVSLDTPLNGGAGPTFEQSTKRWSFDCLNENPWLAASCVPSACSVQIMVGKSLQNADGICYIGRCKQKTSPVETDLTQTYGEMGNKLVAYSNPRLCSAGKLALRGVQADMIPANMSELADFTTLGQIEDLTFYLKPTNESVMDGFLPIFLYNPDRIKVTVLVCFEWRVRFDPSNPANASHILHKPATDHQWYDTMKQYVDQGNGIIDIVEKVADSGLVPLASRAAALLGGA